MVIDLHDDELDKRQQKTLQRLDEPHEYFSKNGSRKIQKKICY